VFSLPAVDTLLNAGVTDVKVWRLLKEIAATVGEKGQKVSFFLLFWLSFLFETHLWS
jgi:hypothetical protein